MDNGASELVLETEVVVDPFREEIKSLAWGLKYNIVALGDKLSIVYSEQKYISWGYASLDDYTYEELGIKSREVRSIRRAAILHARLGLPEGELNQIGIAKTNEIAQVMDDDNKEKLIGMAKEMTVRELHEAIKGYKENKDLKHNRRIGFYYIPIYEEYERETIEESFELAGKYIGSDSKTEQILALCQEFLGTYGDSGSHDLDAISKETVPAYEVMKRYGWRCANEDCRKRLTLSSHHIVFRSKDPSLVDDLNNQIPLCLEDHNEIHLRGGELVQMGDKFVIKRKEG